MRVFSALRYSYSQKGAFCLQSQGLSIHDDVVTEQYESCSPPSMPSCHSAYRGLMWKSNTFDKGNRRYQAVCQPSWVCNHQTTSRSLRVLNCKMHLRVSAPQSPTNGMMQAAMWHCVQNSEVPKTWANSVNTFAMLLPRDLRAASWALQPSRTF